MLVLVLENEIARVCILIVNKVTNDRKEHVQTNLLMSKHTTLRILWRYRNEFAFASKRPNLNLLFNDIKLLSFNWIANIIKKIH